MGGYKNEEKIIASLLTLAMAVSLLAGCSNSGSSTLTSSDVQDTEQESSAENNEMVQEAGSGEAVTIKVFSNLPDRKNGQGLVEQMIIDEYMAANPNVTIEVGGLTRKPIRRNLRHM